MYDLQKIMNSSTINEHMIGTEHSHGYDNSVSAISMTKNMTRQLFPRCTKVDHPHTEFQYTLSSSQTYVVTVITVSSVK